MMSPTLQSEVTAHTHAQWIMSLNFVSQCTDEVEKATLVIAIAHKLQSLCCGAKEDVIKPGELCEKLYIVEKGLLACNGKIIGKSQCVGDDIVLAKYRWRRHYSARSLTFVDLHSLHASDLTRILQHGDFNTTRRVVRRVASRIFIEFRHSVEW